MEKKKRPTNQDERRPARTKDKTGGEAKGKSRTGGAGKAKLNAK